RPVACWGCLKEGRCEGPPRIGRARRRKKMKSNPSSRQPGRSAVRSTAEWLARAEAPEGWRRRKQQPPRGWQKPQGSGVAAASEESFEELEDQHRSFQQARERIVGGKHGRLDGFIQ